LELISEELSIKSFKETRILDALDRTEDVPRRRRSKKMSLHSHH
jgi:hypothetical protein